MTQSGDLPTSDPGSPGSPDPPSATPSPLGTGSDWYTPWTPATPGASPDAPAGGPQPGQGGMPDPSTPWGAPAGPAPAPLPFGAPPNAAGPEAPAPYGQPPYGQPPYGQGPYGSGFPGYPGMGYRGWRRGMYGPMGGGRPTGPFLRRRAVTHTVLGAILLAIGIVITVVSLNSAGGGANIVYVPWFLIVIGGMWFFGGLSMLARTSRFR
ncbi:MAG: hypothetical protein ACLQT7_03675 [Candidatus Dormibacteria bacterium]